MNILQQKMLPNELISLFVLSFWFLWWSSHRPDNPVEKLRWIFCTRKCSNIVAQLDDLCDWFLWWSSHWAVEKFRWIFCTRKCELFRVNAVVSRSAIKSVSTHKMQNNIVRCKNYCMMQHNITRRKTIWRHAKEYYEMQNNITRCKTTLLNAKENIWDAKQYCKPWFFQTKLQWYTMALSTGKIFHLQVLGFRNLIFTLYALLSYLV